MTTAGCVAAFEQWEAATGAGLDAWRWETGGYPRWFMERTVAWHRLHGLVELHQADAVETKLEQSAGRK